MSNFRLVKQFHQKLKLPVGAYPLILDRHSMERRLKFMKEEIQEIEDAFNQIDTYLPGTLAVESDIRWSIMAKLFDGLIDLDYVVLGTAVMMGLPWDTGFLCVHEANMRKICVPSEDGHKWGVQKPEGWQPPDLIPILKRWRFV